MRNTLQRVLESASSPHILAQVPELGEQLRQLQLLVKRSRDAEAGAEDEQGGSTSKDSHDTSHGSQQSVPPASAPSLREGANFGLGHSSPERLYRGVMVTHQPTGHHQEPPCTYPMSEGTGNYQIIAAPTTANASFAATASYVFTPTPTSGPSVSSASSFSPWSALPMPASGAYAEHGFARRLHRFTTEKAAYLICMPNPPPEKMMRVFGFARLFETTEQIRERTIAVLARTREQPLHNWNYPFHHLGGAGTHIPQSVRDGGEPANSDPGTRGFRFGPMDQATSQIRDSLLTISQNIRMPGLQGLFWDCEEVEWYMRQNGVVIPDVATDFCAVEVQAGCFQYPEVRHDDRGEHHPRVANLPDDDDPATSHVPDSSTGNAMGGPGTWQYVGGTGTITISDHGFIGPHVPVAANQYQHPSAAPASTGGTAGKVMHLDVSKFLNGKLLFPWCGRNAHS